MLEKIFLCGLLIVSAMPLHASPNLPITSQSTPNKALETTVSTQSNPFALLEAEEQRRIEKLAREWGVTVEDWKRVELLQQGPRKYWSPNLDPLTLLGVEARSENERRRIALIQAKAEFERTDRELAYQRSYDAAFAELYGNVLPINPAQMPVPKVEPNRKAVFVTDNCSACDAKVKRLQKDKASFDIYMLGMVGNDAAIRDWARRVGVDAKHVQSRQITLNHDAGTLKSIVGDSALPRLPATFIRAENSGLWVPE